MKPSYLYNGVSSVGKMVSLYWDRYCVGNCLCHTDTSSIFYCYQCSHDTFNWNISSGSSCCKFDVNCQLYPWKPLKLLQEIQLSTAGFFVYNLTWDIPHKTWTHWDQNKMATIFQTTWLKYIFLIETLWISIEISLNFVPKGPTNNILALVQIMAWCWPGD